MGDDRDGTANDAASEAESLAAELHSLIDRMAAVDLSQCSDEALVAVAASTERAINRLTYHGDREIVECSDRSIPLSLGFNSIYQFMNARLRISDPVRRKKQLQATTAFRSLTGELGEPEYPTLARAFSEGLVGPSHNRVVIDYLRKIPDAIPHDQKVAAESMLSGLACEHTPDQIAELGARLLSHLDPDGDLVEDKDRKRQRRLYIGRQDAQKMSKLTAYLTPAARARLEMFLEVWGRAGMNNPDDPGAPSGAYADADPTSVAAAAERDPRTLAQRNHDALDALMTKVLDQGVLGGSHRGLPVQLIIKADLNELRAEVGAGVTASGSLLPIHEVIEMAGRSDHWLALFDGHRQVPLYLGRSVRLASRGQRIASFARDSGHMCSAPHCDQAATRVEMHHAKLDYAKGGLTDIDGLAPACPKHNRRVGTAVGQFTTGVYEDGPHAGRCWWQLNAAPGAPPHPKQVNTLPDVGSAFDSRLAAVRASIHGDDSSRSPDQNVSASADSVTSGGESAAREDIRLLEIMRFGWAVQQPILDVPTGVD